MGWIFVCFADEDENKDEVAEENESILPLSELFIL